jgi:hypothetical protein
MNETNRLIPYHDNSINRVKPLTIKQEYVQT